MTIVSSKEFAGNQEKYFDMAMNEQVYVQRESDNITFIISRDEKKYLEPDDDLRRAISADEFRKRLIVAIDKIDKRYANKCK
jgi:hypothetical protein